MSYFNPDDVFLVKTIFEHCDIIFSCRKYICLFSGASVLASAVKKDSELPVVEVFVSENMRNYVEKEKGYNFKNLIYKFV